jgi:hypothetical protein
LFDPKYHTLLQETKCFLDIVAMPHRHGLNPSRRSSTISREICLEHAAMNFAASTPAKVSRPKLCPGDMMPMPK